MQSISETRAEYLHNSPNVPAGYTCIIPASILQKSCNILIDYLQNTCNLLAKYLRNACIILYATIQSTHAKQHSNVITITHLMQHTCRIHQAYREINTCNIPANYLQDACKVSSQPVQNNYIIALTYLQDIPA